MENTVTKGNAAIIFGTVRFINEDDRKRDKFTVTLAVTPNSKQAAEDAAKKIRQLAPTLPADGNVLSQKELNNTAGIIAEWISRGQAAEGD